MDTTRSRKKRISGWISIKDPEDLERALVRMLNKILSSDDPLSHAGRFSSLANTWLNSRRLRLELIEMKELEDRLAQLEEIKDYRENKQREDLLQIKTEMKELDRLEKEVRINETT